MDPDVLHFDATMEELWTPMCCINIYHGGIVRELGLGARIGFK